MNTFTTIDIISPHALCLWFAYYNSSIEWSVLHALLFSTNFQIPAIP